jgi:site-specific DNA-cytosine methylase
LNLTARLWLGDCLELMPSIPDGSVDLIACDLPYGVTKSGWDKTLPIDRLWAEYCRVLTPTGTVVMTSMGILTAKLMLSAEDLFKYTLVWEKSRATCVVQAKYRPMSAHEDVLVFSKGKVGTRAKHPMTYNPQGLVELDKPLKRKQVGISALYDSYADPEHLNEWTQTHTNYPRSVQRFNSVARPVHNTQKPVALMDWIIRTYSNPGDVVLDNCLGSGTTGVAALAAGRNFIGIEKKPEFYETAVKRVMDAAPEGVTFDTDMPLPKSDLVDEIIERKRAAYWASQREQDPAIRYATLCSGVEAVSLAWDGLGYEAVFFSETGEFQSKFLAERYPTVPNVGDMTLIDGRAYAGKLDVLWASTPCQTFSRDGHGSALDDPRGALTLTAVKLADEINPPVVILENVPNLLTVDNGEAFGQVLAALVGEDVPLVPAGSRWTNAGAVCGPRRNVAWRVLDAQYAGLAQRRERVFVVACPVGGADPAAILLEQGGHGDADALLRAIEAEEAASRAAGRSVVWFNGDRTPKWNDRIAYTLKANGGFGNLSGVMVDGDVRRLTPEEREALMGMPRGYTDVAGASDAKRNEAIGNSLAVPDVRWGGGGGGGGGGGRVKKPPSPSRFIPTMW